MPTSVTESLQQSFYKKMDFKEIFPSALRSANESNVLALSTQCMFIRKDRKECMFTWTTVHSQNDGKLQEWQKAGVNLEQLQHTHTHTRLCTLSKSVCVVLSGSSMSFKSQFISSLFQTLKKSEFCAH